MGEKNCIFSLLLSACRETSSSVSLGLADFAECFPFPCSQTVTSLRFVQVHFED